MTTLAAQLESLNASVREMAPEQVIHTIDAANRRLAASGLAARALPVGARAPDFVLPDATGRSVESSRLLARGPLVVKFYRGAWCPYCNLDLKAWQRHLPELRELGAALVAISPQTPDASLALAEKHALEFAVLSDLGNSTARQFGLVYTLDEAMRPVLAAFGVELPAYNGDSSLELPVPATYIVERDGTIAGAWIEPDYRRRAEPGDVLTQLRERVSA